ncbi:MAG: hypothetical protein ABJA67_13480, partial [Chthonomonadales bacterium]
TSIQSFINRNVVWKLYPDRRYMFEFVGIGEEDRDALLQSLSTQLQMGLINPEQAWAQLDICMPDHIQNHPASQLPMPWAQGYGLIDGAQQQEDAKQQQMMAQQQQIAAQQQSQAQASAQQPQDQGQEQGQEPNGEPQEPQEPQEPKQGHLPPQMQKAIGKPVRIAIRQTREDRVTIGGI